MIGSRHEKKWQSISCESICSLGSKSEIKYNAIFQRFINGTIKFMVTMVTICLCSYFMLHKLFYAKSVWKKLLYTNAEKRKFLFVLRVVCAVRKKNERFGFSCFNNEYIKRDWARARARERVKKRGGKMPGYIHIPGVLYWSWMDAKITHKYLFFWLALIPYFIRILYIIHIKFGFRIHRCWLRLLLDTHRFLDRVEL